MKIKQTECSEMSAYKIQTPGNYPEGSIQQSSCWMLLLSWKSWIAFHVLQLFTNWYPVNVYLSTWLVLWSKIHHVSFMIYSYWCRCKMWLDCHSLYPYVWAKPWLPMFCTLWSVFQWGTLQSGYCFWFSIIFISEILYQMHVVIYNIYKCYWCFEWIFCMRKCVTTPA
jgi:hypothetical protein